MFSVSNLLNSAAGGFAVPHADLPELSFRRIGGASAAPRGWG